MVEIEEMNEAEMKRLLQQINYGHLGCVRDQRPYVVPIHYAYADPHLYIYTTEGQKTEFISENPEICLQVEDVRDAANWRSVIATGKAERLTAKKDVDDATKLVLETNPTLTPAQNLMWIDVWGRASVKVIYRLTPHILSGRATVPSNETRGPRGFIQ